MKMNIKLLSACAVAISLAGACIEEADITATLSETKREELAKTNPDKIFNASLTGMYQDMQQYVKTDLSHNYFGQKSFDYLTSLMGNDMVMTNRYAMSIYHYILDYWGENYTPTANRWSEYYNTITNANKILKTATKGSEDETLLYYRAVALGFRGYAYLQLTYLYQYPYYMGVEGTKWGKSEVYDYSKKPCVPIITEETEGDQPLSSLDAVYNRLLEDLEESYSIFKALGCEKTDVATDFDGCVAATYLARAYMVKHDWDKAIKYAQVVIDNFDCLDTEDQILQGFSDITLKDVVFGCDITADNSTIYASWFSQMDSYSKGYAGIGVYRVAFEPLVDRIADDDIRLKWFCCERSTGVESEGNTYILLRDTKYVAPAEYLSVKFIGAGRSAIVNSGGDGTGWELGDYIYLRSEEAWFVKAEALAHKGESGEAIKVLEDVMKTRQPSYSYTFTDKASLIEEINFQKRVEFWGEGIEYLDNRRLNIPVDRTDETWGKDNNNHFSGAKKIYAAQDDRCFLYQIPISEIENNTKLTDADQN